MLQLPADPSADEVRHKLLARMAYGLLQANAATGDPSYLHDGQAMCELYLAKHEELFGDTEPARAQRGEIYELLYEFDSRLDALDPEQLELELAAADEPEAAVAAVASPSPRASSPGATEEICDAVYPIPWIWYTRQRKMNRRIAGSEGGNGEWYQKWHARYLCRQWQLDHGELPLR